MANPTFKVPPLPSTTDVPGLAGATTVALRRSSTANKQAAGFSGSGRVVTATTFIASTDYFVWADSTAGIMTLTLPRISEYTRMIVVVQRIAGANAVTLAARGTDTIDGAASITVTVAVMLSPKDNGTWHVCMTSTT